MSDQHDDSGERSQSMSQDDITADAESSLDLPDEMFRTGDNPEDTILRMYRRTEGVRQVPAKFTEVDGEALFEGDIVLGTAEEARKALTSPAADRGVGITGQQFRWKTREIPYVTEPALRDRVEKAIAHWEQKTPFRFPKRTNQADYLSFEAGSGCSSRV